MGTGSGVLGALQQQQRLTISTRTPQQRCHATVLVAEPNRSHGFFHCVACRGLLDNLAPSLPPQGDITAGCLLGLELSCRDWCCWVELGQRIRGAPHPVFRRYCMLLWRRVVLVRSLGDFPLVGAHGLWPNVLLLLKTETGCLVTLFVPATAAGSCLWSSCGTCMVALWKVSPHL